MVNYILLSEQSLDDFFDLEVASKSVVVFKFYIVDYLLKLKEEG